MLAANGSSWFDHHPPESRWPSFALSALLTAALFTSAIVAMRSVRLASDGAPVERVRAVAIRLAPPAPSKVRAVPILRPAPRPVATPDEARPSRERSAPTVPPAATPVSAAPAMPGVPAAVAPRVAVPTAGVPRDSAGSSGSAASSIPHGILPRWSGLSDTPLATHAAGAPVAPAGVTGGMHTPNSARYRDSVITARMAAIPEMAKTRPFSPEAAAILGAGKRAAVAMAHRATTAGNARDVVTQVGEGVNGVGAVGGGQSGLHAGGGLNGVGISGSVDFPLFSSGPSRAQRARDEKIDADNQARLRRLEDRALLLHDPVRADSLKHLAQHRDSLMRDSLMRDSLRRRGVVRPDRVE